MLKEEAYKSVRSALAHIIAEKEGTNYSDIVVVSLLKKGGFIFKYAPRDEFVYVNDYKKKVVISFAYFREDSTYKTVEYEVRKIEPY